MAEPSKSKVEQALADTILDVFDRKQLQRLLEYELNRRYDHLVAEGSFRDEVYGLVMAARREGWLLDFATAIANARPSNQLLVRLRKDLGELVPSVGYVGPAGRDLAKSAARDDLRLIVESLYLLILIDQFPEGMWGASIEGTADLYGQKSDPGSISVGISCALALTAIGRTASLPAIQLFRQHLVSRRSVRGAFGMRRFVGSASYPVAEILEHSRHTAAAVKYFLTCDGIEHDYVCEGAAFLLDPMNRTARGLWVEHGEKLDERVDPVTVATVVECLESLHAEMSSNGRRELRGTTVEQIDQAIRLGVGHLFESPFRATDGMWLYRFTTEAERERVTRNKYRYTSGILRSIAKSCFRTGEHSNSVATMIDALEGVSSRYGGLPPSEASNVPSLSATINLIEAGRHSLRDAPTSAALVAGLSQICRDSGVVEASMAPGWASVLQLASTDENLLISTARAAELNEVASMLKETGPMVRALPPELSQHGPFVRALLNRIQQYVQHRTAGDQL